ncbi:adenylyl-sulfate kinase [Labilibaculum sp. DW002]|uniref:Adenylyl-sulfate kinase n=1 Tax=Paralabilibaculum antarcticum TaxID=2912572 RepID=A0ABT5VQL3_9BACT|nr:adenylyl-sulfate kinase [Labilibaculum sp. DW002]MDE5417713.1 adenylyl-sulfate kinase [Labilibaculum sp. DW002]
MTTKATNIHPVFDRIIGRDEKEQFLNQKACVVWMTGLSGSGKTTIAIGLEKELQKRGFLTQILDGDNIRTGINKNLGFSEEDRTENIRRIAEVSKLFVNCGIITINCFVSPTLEIRKQAKDIIGEDFREIYVNASYEECEKRDVKGLYKKARNGEIKNFTGLDAPFEAPENPFLEIKTSDMTPEQSVEEVVNAILPQLIKNK